MGDHTEVVDVEYDPESTSYKTLLNVFWSKHDPASQAWKRQYWNAIFYRNERQKEQAEASLARRKNEINGSIETEILPIRSFTRAETYHQKYYLQQNSGLVKKLMKPFPDMDTFLDSTVATRANSFLARKINEEELRKRLDADTYSTLSSETVERTEAILCGTEQ